MPKWLKVAIGALAVVGATFIVMLLRSFLPLASERSCDRLP